MLFLMLPFEIKIKRVKEIPSIVSTGSRDAGWDLSRWGQEEFLLIRALSQNAEVRQ